VVVAAEPVFDSSGRLLAVVFAALDTGWLNAAIFGNDMEIPAGATLHQVDAEGRVLTYDPGAGSWTTSDALDDNVFASIRATDRGLARGRNARSAACIYGFARLESPLKQRSLYITLEQPQRTAFAESNRRLIRNLALLALVTVLAFGAVWFVSERLVLKRVSRIVRTTRKLARGDLAARVGPMAGNDEILELAGAFDEMAVTLENRMDEEKRAKEELRQLAAYLQQVREDERARIAREIHDDFGQSLTILKMDLSWLKHHLPTGASALHDKIDAASGVIDAALETLHRVSSELRPVILDDFGIVAAIEWQLEEFKQRTGLACELERTVDEIDLTREQATAVFRIFQEALTNVIRHSGADRIDVRLAVHEDTLHLELEDNGRGIRKAEIEASDAFGLIGMRERLRPWNGSIRFTGNPAKGTCVQVVLPLGKQGG
jgi:signal transduction histidine kinase